MSESTTCPLDLVEELRLRRWARRNYVPADRRGGRWHPVVLDEMCAKDREIGAGARGAPADERELDRPRLGMGSDPFFGQPISELTDNRRICSLYVPLVPVHLTVHPAHDGPAEPNRTRAAPAAAVEWPL